MTAGLPATLFVLAPIYGTILVAKARKFNWQLKTATSITVWNITFNLIQPMIRLLGGETPERGYFWNANFKVWNTASQINTNIFGIITLVAGITACLFLTVGLFNIKAKKAG